MAHAGRLLALPLLAVALVIAGCGDTGTGVTQWTAVTDTTTIYSLQRPELTLKSAFNFHDRATVSVEATDASTVWDIALDTRGGTLVIVPPGALGIKSQVRILQLPGVTFDNVVEAPADTLLYTATQTLPVVLNGLYIIKTDLRSTGSGASCSYYAKMSPIAIDITAQSLTFINGASPICNDRRLIPPDTT